MVPVAWLIISPIHPKGKSLVFFHRVFPVKKTPKTPHVSGWVKTMVGSTPMRFQRTTGGSLAVLLKIQKIHGLNVLLVFPGHIISVEWNIFQVRKEVSTLFRGDITWLTKVYISNYAPLEFDTVYSCQHDSSLAANSCCTRWTALKAWGIATFKHFVQKCCLTRTCQNIVGLVQGAANQYSRERV